MAQNPSSETESDKVAASIREGWANRVGAIVDAELHLSAARVLSLFPGITEEEFTRHAALAFQNTQRWPSEHPFKATLMPPLPPKG